MGYSSPPLRRSGSVVAELEVGRREDRAGLLGGDVERLVVDAMKARGSDEDDVQAAVAAHWRKLAKHQKQPAYK